MGQSHGANPRTAPSYPQHSCVFSTPLPTLTEASELIAKEMVPELAGVRNGNESLRSQPWPSHQLLGRTDPREEAYERTPLFAPATLFHLRNIRPVRDLPDGLQPSPEALSRPRQSVLWWGAPHGPRQHRALSWHCRHRRGNLTALRSLFPGEHSQWDADGVWGMAQCWVTAGTRTDPMGLGRDLWSQTISTSWIGISSGVSSVRGKWGLCALLRDSLCHCRCAQKSEIQQQLWEQSGSCVSAARPTGSQEPEPAARGAAARGTWIFWISVLRCSRELLQCICTATLVGKI